MKAGRELDRLVAEKAMGLMREVRILGTTDVTIIYSDNPYFDNGVSKDDAMKGYCLPPHYSTSIADAWAVFCKFTSRFIWFDDATDTWHCHLDPTRSLMIDCRYHGTSEDETGAEAICLAALKAVGADVKEDA